MTGALVLRHLRPLTLTTLGMYLSYILGSTWFFVICKQGKKSRKPTISYAPRLGKSSYFYAKSRKNKHKSLFKAPTKFGIFFLIENEGYQLQLRKTHTHTWPEICWIFEETYKKIKWLCFKTKQGTGFRIGKHHFLSTIHSMRIFVPVSVPQVPQSVDDRLGALPSSPDHRLGWIGHRNVLFWALNPSVQNHLQIPIVVV